MKVLLINAGSYHLMQKPIIPLGLLSIATNLKNNLHDVMIYDRAVQGIKLDKVLKRFQPDIVGISALTFGSFKDAIKISKAIKKIGIPIVWGGQVPSLVPEIVFNEDSVDYLVIGDGEFAMLEIIEALENKRSIKEVAGIAFMETGKLFYTKQRDLEDLAKFPVIDWSFVNPKRYFVPHVNGEKMLHLYASKGCPGQCTYCYNPCFNQRKWRPRPLEAIVKEIECLVGEYGADGIYFADDLMSPNKNYLDKFCAAIGSIDLDFTWGCNMRADVLSRDDLEIMFEAGCRWIFFGIESGSPKRQASIKKKLNLDRARQTITWCKELGILTTTSFILGYPEETEEELKETVQYMLDLPSDVKVTGHYEVIPQSELHHFLLDSGKIKNPQSLKEWKSLAGMFENGKKFSNTNLLEKNVIINRFLYNIITSNIKSKSKTAGEKSHYWARRVVKQAVDFLRMRSIKSVVLVFISAKRFLTIMFYAHMFPGILKKYGLK